jgi:hypothetical protein
LAADSTDAAELYGLPLAEFTAARNELSARVRKSGDRAEADAIKRLAKPSITAWALNQVARKKPKAIEGLLEMGAELSKAQRALLAGGGQAAFREAAQAQRRAIEDLLHEAAGVLNEDSHPPSKATLDRLEATLRAASGDSEGATLLREGRLTQDLDPAGFGFGAVDSLPEPIPFPARKAPPVAPKPAAEQSSGEDLHQAQAAVRDLQRQLDDVRKRAAEAEREAAAARAAAHSADRVWAEARQAAERAERETKRAQEQAQDAAEALAKVRAEVDRAAEAVEQAQDEVRRLRQP